MKKEEEEEEEGILIDASSSALSCFLLPWLLCSLLSDAHGKDARGLGDRKSTDRAGGRRLRGSRRKDSSRVVRRLDLDRAAFFLSSFVFLNLDLLFSRNKNENPS